QGGAGRAPARLPRDLRQAGGLSPVLLIRHERGTQAQSASDGTRTPATALSPVAGAPGLCGYTPSYPHARNSLIRKVFACLGAARAGIMRYTRLRWAPPWNPRRAAGDAIPGTRPVVAGAGGAGAAARRAGRRLPVLQRRPDPDLDDGDGAGEPGG